VAQLTVRDNAGMLNLSIEIVTTGTATLATTPIQSTANTIFITQPFGFVTFSYNVSRNTWYVLDSFGFQAKNTFLTQQMTVSTLQMVDVTILSRIHSLTVANGILQLNDQPVTGGSIPDPFNVSNIHASTMTLSSNLVFSPTERSQRLNVSGGVNANFITINDQAIPTPSAQTLSVSNSILYRNIYPVSPVAGYIEFAVQSGALDEFITPSVYPFYIYQNPTILELSNGPWNTQSAIFTGGAGFVSGIIGLPGFRIQGSNQTTTFCDINNNTSMPLYSNINRVWSSTSNYLDGVLRINSKE
jgi:hypothetical protein